MRHSAPRRKRPPNLAVSGPSLGRKRPKGHALESAVEAYAASQHRATTAVEMAASLSGQQADHPPQRRPDPLDLAPERRVAVQVGYRLDRCGDHTHPLARRGGSRPSRGSGSSLHPGPRSSCAPDPAMRHALIALALAASAAASTALADTGTYHRRPIEGEAPAEVYMDGSGRAVTSDVRGERHEVRAKSGRFKLGSARASTASIPGS